MLVRLGTAIAALLLAACTIDRTRSEPEPPVSVIPMSAHVQLAEGMFSAREGTSIIVVGDDSAHRIGRYFADLVARTTGVTLKISAEQADSRGAISLSLDPGLQSGHPEGYELAISPDRVALRAAAPAGLFYGTATLWQLLTPGRGDRAVASVRSMQIRDEPRFRWRGFMLDSARHYMPPEFVKRLIDWMALHKLNTLHWHLTDDQGWRLEILKYPRLTEVGAWRTPAGAGAAGGLYGGYYTQEEVRGIVRHAAERFVTIVPEFDMPGHAQAAIAAYPRLGTEGARVPVSADWGVHDWLFNVEEDTFTFIEDVLTEMIELFPGDYIHVGGDEAVKHRWHASPRVQERMRELGIADETKLQAWFIARIERFLRGKGRRLIGWDEILEGGLPPTATVMSWRGQEGAIEAARAGHDVVMATNPTLYLDYLQSNLPDEPPGRPTQVTLEDVYRFEPVPQGLGEREAAHILGAQLNAWTEHMRTPARIEHNAFPKVAALAEMLWSSREDRDWSSFRARLPSQFARYRALGIEAADTAFAPTFTLLEDPNADPLRIRLSNQAGFGEIRYTIDGSEPDSGSPRYEGAALQVSVPATLHAATFSDGIRLAEPRTRVLDRAALRTRANEALAPCTRHLVLRLEDDAPLEGERSVFNVDIMNPCWIFDRADLSGISRIEVAVGQLPFNFQIGEDVRRIPLARPQSAHGELEVRLDRCDGERIAVLPLAPAAGRDSVTVLTSEPIAERSGRHDLCLSFTRAHVDPIWAIDRVELVE
jgi:hexosaminidase